MEKIMMKLNLVAAMLLIATAACAYEEENFLGPRWGDRSVKLKIKLTNKDNWVKNPKQVEERIREIEEQRADLQVMQSVKKEELAQGVVEQKSELEQLPTNGVNEIKRDEFVNEVGSTHIPSIPQEMSFFERHQKKIIIGGVIVASLCGFGWYSTHHST